MSDRFSPSLSTHKPPVLSAPSAIVERFFPRQQPEGKHILTYFNMTRNEKQQASVSNPFKKSIIFP